MTWLQRHSPLDEVTDVWDRCFGVGTDQRTESMGHGFSVPPPLAVSLVVHETTIHATRNFAPSAYSSPLPIASFLPADVSRSADSHAHAEGLGPPVPGRGAAGLRHSPRAPPLPCGLQLDTSFTTRPSCSTPTVTTAAWPTPGGRSMECRTGARSASPTRL